MTEAILLLLAMVLAIVLAIALLSIGLNVAEKPDVSDVRERTGWTPGEGLIESRTCNLLSDKARFHERITSMGRRGGALLAGLMLSSSLTGGVWVGGRVFLTTHRLIFLPNAINQALHANLEAMTIDLARIAAVEVRSGFVTSIVTVKGDGAISLRLFSAQAFASKVREAIRTASSAGS